VFVVPEDGHDQQRITNMQFHDCGGLDVSPNGSTVVFSARVNQFPKDSFFVLRLAVIKAINPDDKRFVGGAVILDNGKHHIEPRFSPDGSHVVFLSKSRRQRTLGEALLPFSGTVRSLWEVSVIDIQTLSVTVIDKSNSSIAGHGYSSDGNTIAYTKDDKVCHWSVADIKPNKKQ
jgi:Tol biopolymer transport system component